MHIFQVWFLSFPFLQISVPCRLLMSKKWEASGARPNENNLVHFSRKKIDALFSFMFGGTAEL